MASLLTVVVPTYNGSRFLRQTLDSLGRQQMTPDVIVVDDGSSDGSAEIAEAHPAVTRVVRQFNSGAAAARNRGLALAGTHFVAFLDQDDLWHESRTMLLLELAEETGARAVATSEQVFASRLERAELIAEQDPRADWPALWIQDGDEMEVTAGPLGGTGAIDEITVDRLMQGAAFVTTSVMYEREAAIVAGGCATFVKAADDHVLNVNVANLFGPIPCLDRPAVFYRVHRDATSNSSPLVRPLLTLQLALRHGRSLPEESAIGHNLEHLLRQVADEPGLSVTEQLALLLLSVPARERRRWLLRWARRRLRSR